MKLVFIFKDGLTYTPEPMKSFALDGHGDFIERLEQGKENNAQIKFTDHDGNSIQRTYNDLKSVNILMEE